MTAPVLSVRRFRGLGNIFLLAPVLLKAACARRVELITEPAWADAVQDLFPEIAFSLTSRLTTIDLDLLTPLQEEAAFLHRIECFGALLGIKGPFARLALNAKSVKPLDLVSPYVVFAPDASHAARSWPAEYVQRFCALAGDWNVVLVGDRSISVPDVYLDLRAQLAPRQLMSLIAHADAVVTMDSACLHVAEAFSRPAIAIFGGVDYRLRCNSLLTTIPLSGGVDCYPCNKRESCNGTYDCVRSSTPELVIAHLRARLS
jgi:ADP-heptose:LPS heptosyltransferase